MLGFVLLAVGAVLVGAMVLAFRGESSASDPLPDMTRRLERVLDALTQRARAELPADQLAALTSELREIMSIEQHMIASGARRAEARRISLEGAIQSVGNHLTLNKQYPG